MALSQTVRRLALLTLCGGKTCTSYLGISNGSAGILIPLLGTQNVIRLKTDRPQNTDIDKYKVGNIIKWKPPEKLPWTSSTRTGDLKPLPKVDKKRPLLGFEKSVELQNASEEVKKVFSVEFGGLQKAVRVGKHDLIKKIQRHKLDFGSTEVKIAALTVKIRQYQLQLNRGKQNSKLKCDLLLMVDRRKKYLRNLREMDYKRFEWIIEELGIIYKSPPQVSPGTPLCVTRKNSLRQLTQRYCDNLIKQKLDAYHAELKSQHEEFLKEKEETCKWIAQEEEELGIQRK